MSRLLNLLFSTTGVVVALLAATIWIWRRPASRAARRFLITISVTYAVISTYAVPATVGSWLSSGYHPFHAGDIPRGVTALVVLGAGGANVFGWEGRLFTISNTLTAGRVLEAARVFKLIDPAYVVISGGVSDALDPTLPSAVLMRDALVNLGVPPSVIKLETRSRDTHDQAVFVAPMLRSLKIEHLVLVTSDIHMRRSQAVFRAHGWHAIPAIAPDPSFNMRRIDRWSPSSSGLSLSAQVIHELFGIPYYKLRGWL